MKSAFNHRLFSFFLTFLILCFLPACRAANIGEGEAEQETDAENSVSSVTDEEDADFSNLTDIKISELMPSNKDYLSDEDGDSSDWIELVNLGNLPVSLSGCWLSNDEGMPYLWQFPDTTLPEGERILVFCSGKNKSDRELHSNFTLSKSGGAVLLSAPSGTLLDRADYPATEKDSSVVFLSEHEERTGEGTVTWLATPGFPNSDQGYEDYILDSDSPGALVIAEAVSYNDSFAEKPGRFYDWVELKNTSDEPILLSKYFLTDRSDEPQKVRLPEVLLPAGETYIVFCSGDTGLTSSQYFHAGFAIGAVERLYLFDSDGVLSDRLYLHDLPLYGSIGRMEDCAGFWYFENPSPGKPNLNGCRSICEKPEVSLSPGIYNQIDELKISLSGEGNIYYTLDGSVPDPSDAEYTGPLTISKTTVLRAVSVEEGKLTSRPATFSYILNEDDALPVTSLVCEPGDMFGSSGVYVAARGLNAKCDAAIEFFDTNGDGFSADCSAELHGAHSRTTFKKKSFELKFASRYGGDVEYDVFQDGIRTRFSTLLLRGGSSANLDIVRDCFASKLMVETCPWLYPQDLRYTAVYINGEYYGIYALREAYSEQYFSDHTGMPEDGITMARGPVGGGELLDLLNDITSHSMASQSAYEDAASKLDMNSLAGWMAIQSYFDNRDINGNIRYVKLSGTGKWQLIVYDLDYSCLTTTTGWDTVLASYQLGPVCQSLLANQEFRDLLLNTCAELYRNGFRTERILESYDEMLSPLDEISVQKDCRRWGDNYTDWVKYTKAMRDHMSDSRMVHWLAGLKSLTRATNEQMHLCFPAYY